MELGKDKKKCCGCTACYSICPQKAISMKEDIEGFSYPQIDEKSCIKCGLCEDVCPLKVKELYKESNEYPKFYGFKNKNTDIRMKSSSGGIYTSISDYMLNGRECNKDIDNENKCKYICYGAVFDKNFNVCHKPALTKEERNQFRGSKYVQSNLGDVFSEIKENLNKGHTVLFTGTPCQVAGLKRYLLLTKCETMNLVLNDIVCHGTPSPKIWRDFKGLLEFKYKSRLKFFTFRFKEEGWRNYNVKVVFQNGKSIINSKDSLMFSNLFKTDLILRPSCYMCKFANLHRPSDITIGDFWGIEKVNDGFDDNKGVSLIIVNTKKGEYIFNKIKESGVVFDTNKNECLQHNLKKATQLPINRSIFWCDYYKEGFEKTEKRYGEPKIKEKMITITKNILKRIGLFNYLKTIIRGW